MRNVRTVVALVCISSLLGACGVARNERFVYHDLRCSLPPPGGSPSCQEVGDGLSYVKCTADSECPASDPFCRVLGLFNGGGYSCNASVRICRLVDRNDCSP